ncbi:MAG: hypothetical protein CM15mP111_1220 [Hyphomicrobiales bacterium]|nr:MAG: hypothetical protein CM15mP111_1220 [Hyphomicrobiales bacterium]
MSPKWMGRNRKKGIPMAGRLKRGTKYKWGNPQRKKQIRYQNMEQLFKIWITNDFGFFIHMVQQVRIKKGSFLGKGVLRRVRGSQYLLIAPRFHPGLLKKGGLKNCFLPR